jgi:hypothetical protein
LSKDKTDKCNLVKDDTSKQLKFLDWREAFYLYQSLKWLTGEDKVNTQNY